MSSMILKLGAVAAGATMLSVLNVAVAQAGAAAGSCIGSGGVITCAAGWGGDGGGLGRVLHVPGPLSDDARSSAFDRDRRWAARCQPAMRYDRYGVARYTYTAPGCEFGRLTD